MKQCGFCKDHLTTLQETLLYRGQVGGRVPEDSNNALGERWCSLTKGGNCKEEKRTILFCHEGTTTLLMN